ncbi:MAG: MarR family winged helix-turn-helix transcriptional regulator [Bacteroidota bacterium]
MDLSKKITAGLERLSEVFKTLLWEKAKQFGISPIQIQILLFINSHQTEQANVSYLAMEFNVTKPTISDAVRVLLKKGFLEKDFSPTDARRYNLILTDAGRELIQELESYSLPVDRQIGQLEPSTQELLFKALNQTIFRLNQEGVIQVQRTCFGCRFYQGDRNNSHYCNFLKMDLPNPSLRLDCSDFESVS